MNGGAGATRVALSPPAASSARAAASPGALAGPRWAGFWLAAGLWLIPVLISSTQTYLFLQHKQERHLSFLAAFVWQGLPWLFWALMTPAIVWLGRRYPLERKGFPGNVAVHLIANLAMAPGHVALNALTGRLIGQESYVKAPFIEVFHKILKSGCKAEEARLRTAERLVNLIAVFCSSAFSVGASSGRQ